MPVVTNLAPELRLNFFLKIDQALVRVPEPVVMIFA